MTVSPEYAGDLSAQEAWELLERDPRAQLVDVRTTAEWSYVGIPDLDGLNRQALCVEWQTYPSGTRNAAFEKVVGDKLKSANAMSDTPVLFLCRSGGRSRAAAVAMTKAGFSRAYNIAGGFEGDLDQTQHRGSRNGWKVAGLPWRQT